MTRRSRSCIAALLMVVPTTAASSPQMTPGASEGEGGAALRMPPRVARWRPLITEAAQRFGVPQDWIAAVMAAESGGETIRDGRPITSSAGAMGLMQVMPATYEAMRIRYRLGGDPHDPHDNILAGAAYLRLMHDRFGYPGLFGAYNAGPARYADHLATGRYLPAETRAYVARLAHRPATPAMPSATLSGERLFFMLGSAKSVSPSRENEPVNPPPNGLFVPLTRASQRNP